MKYVGDLTQYFFSSSTTAWMQEAEQRMEQLPRRIASYVTVCATPKTEKKASQMVKLLCACS